MSDKKRIVREFFESIMAGNVKTSLPLFAKNCKQHNPYVSGGMNELMDSMIAVQAKGPSGFHADADSFDPEFAIKHLIEEGDVVVAYTEMKSAKSNPANGGLRQAHIFRFEGDKIAEYFSPQTDDRTL